MLGSGKKCNLRGRKLDEARCKDGPKPPLVEEARRREIEKNRLIFSIHAENESVFILGL